MNSFIFLFRLFIDIYSEKSNAVSSILRMFFLFEAFNTYFQFFLGDIFVELFQ